jgi:hypothetical protein
MQPIILPDLDLRNAHMQRSITLVLDAHSVAPWCLGLTILDHDLAAEVLIQDTSGASVLLQRDAKIKRGGQGVVHWEKRMPRLILTTHTLHSWLRFSLQYYRNPTRYLSHLDSELLSQPPQDGGTDVTIIVSDVRPEPSR